MAESRPLPASLGSVEAESSMSLTLGGGLSIGSGQRNHTFVNLDAHDPAPVRRKERDTHS